MWQCLQSMNIEFKHVKVRVFFDAIIRRFPFTFFSRIPLCSVEWEKCKCSQVKGPCCTKRKFLLLVWQESTNNDCQCSFEHCCLVLNRIDQRHDDNRWWPTNWPNSLGTVLQRHWFHWSGWDWQDAWFYVRLRLWWMCKKSYEFKARIELVGSWFEEY